MQISPRHEIGDFWFEETIHSNPDFEIFRDKKAGVEQLAIYLEAVGKQPSKINKHSTKFNEIIGQNFFSLKLFTNFQRLSPEFCEEVAKENPDVSHQYQIYVMKIISAILQESHDEDALTQWMAYVDASPTNWKEGTASVLQKLGSDLHTTTADAADDDATRDSLATRLDRLRDF